MPRIEEVAADETAGWTDFWPLPNFGAIDPGGVIGSTGRLGPTRDMRLRFAYRAPCS
jgi:hypothetical protein